jgi:hypothetical protein
MRYSFSATLRFVLVSSATLLFAAGCGKKNDAAHNDTVAHASPNDVSNTIANAMNAASGNTSGTHTSATHAVPSDKLAGFLPTISGFNAQDPEKASMNFSGTEYSSASQEFRNGEKNIKVSILDYNYIQGLSAAYAMAINMNIENGEELHHGEKFGNYPGWVDWNKKSNDGTIGIIVNDRIFIIVEGRSGVSLDDMRAVVSKLDLDGIAKASA